MGTFITAQILSVRDSKRLAGTLFAAPLVTLLYSYFAASSPDLLIPPRELMALAAGLLSVLGGEILHFLTVDELADGVFDVILISPLPPWRLLIYKLAVPVAGGCLMPLVCLCMNNALAHILPLMPWEASPGGVALLGFGALLSALAELLSLLLQRRDNVNTHFFLLAGAVGLLVWMYRLLLRGHVWMFLFLILLGTSLPAAGCAALIKKRAKMASPGGKRLFPRLYGEGKIGAFGGLFRKNLSVLRLIRHSAVHFLIAALSPLLGAALASGMGFPAAWGAALGFAPIHAVSNIYTNI